MAYTAPTFVNGGAPPINAANLNALVTEVARLSTLSTSGVNVKDTAYGATGNGTANDSTAIGTAITAAGVGGTVYFPPGTYRVANVAPLSGQTWTGPGVLQRVAGSTASMVTGTDLSDVTFDGLTLDGSRGAATATSNSALFLVRATRARVINCTFRNMPTNNAAVELRGSVGSLVQGNSFTTVGYGVIIGLAYGSTDACHDNRIIGNWITGTDLNPVFVTENVGTAVGTVAGNVQNTVIANNVIKGWGDAGIEAGSGCVRTTIVGNTLDSGGGAVASGILIRDNNWTTVTGNHIIGVTGTNSRGIIAVELNSLTTNLTVTDNLVSGGQYGIYMGHVVGLTMTGNQVTGATSDGVALTWVVGFTFAGNRVWLNGGNGVTVGVFNGTSSTNGTLTGNNVHDNSTAITNTFDAISLLASSADVIITANACKDTRATGKTQRYGVTVTASVVNYVVTNNNVMGNLGVGINDLSATASKVKSGNLTD